MAKSMRLDGNHPQNAADTKTMVRVVAVVIVCCLGMGKAMRMI